jgi:hypothetical protein
VHAHKVALKHFTPPKEEEWRVCNGQRHAVGQQRFVGL